MPDAGFIKIADSETGEEKWIDTSLSHTRKAYAGWWSRHESDTLNTFRKSGVDHVELLTGSDYVKPLINFFESR